MITFENILQPYIINTLNCMFPWGVSTEHLDTQTHTPGSIFE